MRVEIPLESSYESTRLDADVQQTLNWYPHTLRGYRQFPGHAQYADFLSATQNLLESGGDQVQTVDGENVVVLENDAGNDRGMIPNGPNSLVYAVTGPALYSFDESGNGTYIGEISNSPTPVGMATNGTQLIITTGGTPTAYVYTVAGGLQTITDVDLNQAYTVDILDSRFIYDQPSGQFVVSAINDGSTIAADDFATAEFKPDDLLRVKTVNQLAYFFGERTTEIWFTSGVGRPPLDRQAVKEFGIAGRYAVDSIDDMLYFIDDHRRPWVFKGLDMQSIYSPALGEEWDSYGSTVMDTARVQAYALHQENFVDFIFQEAGKTWTFHQETGRWFEKTFTATTVIDAFNVVLAAGYSDKKYYKLDFADYQIDSSNMTRRKDLPLVTGELLGAPGSDIIIDSFRIHLDASAASTVTVYISKDMTTFSSLGSKTVTDNQTLEFWGLGKCREAIFRVESSTNAKIDLLDASIDARALNN